MKATLSTFPYYATVLLLMLSSVSYAVQPGDLTDMDGALLPDSYDPFLGIWGGRFSRWENGIVPIAYNHEGAPAELSVEVMEDRIRGAFSILENIAGIYFDYQGLTTARIFDNTDSLVVIAWDELAEGVAAQAGPDSGVSSQLDFQRLGYFPYLDGRVRFNSTLPHAITSTTILHELIHILGLGHSENPVSLMNYTYLRFALPQQDDIDGLQALYGPPDRYQFPVNEDNLSAENLRPGIFIDQRKLGFDVRRKEAAEDDFEAIDGVTRNFDPDDVIFFRIQWVGLYPGEKITNYTTDPLGNVSIGTAIEVPYISGLYRFYVGKAGGLSSLPGNWIVRVGLEGGLMAERSLDVESVLPIHNRAPTAQLTVQSNGGGSFDLSLVANDSEGDNINIEWYLPGAQAVEDDTTFFSVQIDDDQPTQVFAEVTDDAERIISGGRGPGFGALKSRYLITPAEENVPTYFTSHGILHIPAIEVGGQIFSINFKLTSLGGISLKLLEFDVAPNVGATPITIFDADTSSLVLPRLIVNDNGNLMEVNNLRFQIVAASNPLTIAYVP